MSRLGLVCLITGILIYFEVLRDSIPEIHAPLFSQGGLFTIIFILPLCFSYMLEFMQPNWLTWKRVYWLFAAPLALALIAYYIHCTRRPLPIITDYDQVRMYLHEPEMILRFVLTVFVLIEVTVLSVYTIRWQRLHKARIVNDYSYVDGVDLRWIYTIVALYILYSISVVIAVSFEGAGVKIFFGLVMTLFPIFNVSVCARQRELYIPVRNITVNSDDVSNGAGNTVDYPQNESEEDLGTRLLAMFEKEKIYTDPELSLGKVCATLGTNKTYVSKVINTDLDTNFYALVNDYRIKHAVSLMRNPKLTVNISTVGTEAGFNSRSTFYKLFKEKMGVTPRQFRDGIPDKDPGVN